jgi:hypothetical protein
VTLFSVYARILGAMSLDVAQRNLRHRVEEACREIGVLWLVFVPIDFVLGGDTPGRRTWLLIFLGVGAFLLGGALLTEYRRLRVD